MWVNTIYQDDNLCILLGEMGQHHLSRWQFMCTLGGDGSTPFIKMTIYVYSWGRWVNTIYQDDNLCILLGEMGQHHLSRWQFMCTLGGDGSTPFIKMMIYVYSWWRWVNTIYQDDNLCVLLGEMGQHHLSRWRFLCTVGGDGATPFIKMTISMYSWGRWVNTIYQDDHFCVLLGEMVPHHLSRWWFLCTLGEMGQHHLSRWQFLCTLRGDGSTPFIKMTISVYSWGRWVNTIYEDDDFSVLLGEMGQHHLSRWRFLCTLGGDGSTPFIKMTISVYSWGRWVNTICQDDHFCVLLGEMGQHHLSRWRVHTTTDLTVCNINNLWYVI